MTRMRARDGISGGGNYFNECAEKVLTHLSKHSRLRSLSRYGAIASSCQGASK